MSSYPAVVLADHPASYWRLGEAVGSFTVADMVGGLTGTLAGGVSLGGNGLLIGDTNPAAVFDGGASYILCGDIYDFPANAPFTIEFLINVSQLITRQIIAKLPLAAVDGWDAYLDAATGLIHFRRFTASTSDNASASVALIVGQTAHVAITYTGTAITITVNGTAGTSTASVRALPGNATQVSIGGWLAGLNSIIGTLDEVAIYNYALTTAQITAHYLASLSQLDYPDYQRRVQIVGSDINVPMDIRASAVTLPISISSSLITINMNFTGQTTYVASASQYQALLGNSVKVVGTVNFAAIGTAVSPFTYTVPVGKTFYIQGLAFGAANGVNQVYAVIYQLNIAAVPAWEMGGVNGGAMVFDTPIPVAAGVAVQSFVNMWAAGAAVGFGTASIWGWLQ